MLGSEIILAIIGNTYWVCTVGQACEYFTLVNSLNSPNISMIKKEDRENLLKDTALVSSVLPLETMFFHKYALPRDLITVLFKNVYQRGIIHSQSNFHIAFAAAEDSQKIK